MFKKRCMDKLEAELSLVLADLRRRHDVVPFMKQLMSVDEVQLRLLPAEMRAVLDCSGDFMEPEAGQGPVWLNLFADDEAAEVLLYRAWADDKLYIVAPGAGV